MLSRAKQHVLLFVGDIVVIIIFCADLRQRAQRACWTVWIYAFHICNDLVNYAQQNKGEKTTNGVSWTGVVFIFVAHGGALCDSFIFPHTYNKNFKKIKKISPRVILTPGLFLVFYYTVPSASIIFIKITFPTDIFYSPIGAFICLPHSFSRVVCEHCTRLFRSCIIYYLILPYYLVFLRKLSSHRRLLLT